MYNYPALPVNVTSGRSDPMLFVSGSAGEHESTSLEAVTVNVIAKERSAAIVTEGEGVSIVPSNMVLGVPYVFRIAGKYLIAVKRGEMHVDLYATP